MSCMVRSLTGGVVKGVVGLVGAFGHVVDALRDDPQRLPHLLDPHERPVVAITLLSERDLELEPLVAGIGFFLPEIPVETACPQTRAGDSPLDGLLARVGAHPFRARFRIGLRITMVSYSSSLRGMSATNSRTIRSHPAGGPGPRRRCGTSSGACARRRSPQ